VYHWEPLSNNCRSNLGLSAGGRDPQHPSALSPPSLSQGNRALSPDGSLIVGQRDDALFLWDAFSGQILRRFDAARSALRTPYFKSASFSPDGQLFASGSTDGSIRLWFVSPQYAPQHSRGHQSTVTDVALTPNGRYLASASRDTTSLPGKRSPAK